MYSGEKNFYLYNDAIHYFEYDLIPMDSMNQNSIFKLFLSFSLPLYFKCLKHAILFHFIFRNFLT